MNIFSDICYNVNFKVIKLIDFEEITIKILIINPPASKIIEPYYDEPDFPRTALAFLAGHLRAKLPNEKIDVLDAKFDKLSHKETLSFVLDGKYDLVGVTAMTNEIKSAGRLAKDIKKENNQIYTVIGGVHITAIPEETMREFPEFDYGVIGEGEESFLELINSLINGFIINTPGVCFLKENKFTSYGTSKLLEDQDSLVPAWDLFRPADEYMLQSSRGCPFACNFCMNPGGRIVRPRSVETTLNEIGELLDKMKPKSLYFGDEIFTVKRNRAKEICEGMIERGYHKRVEWWCQTHVNTLDRDLIKIMKKANCKLVGLGIETGDEETFKQMGKGINKQKIKRTIKVLKEEDLNFDCMFILGQPNESTVSAKNTIDFAIELNPATPIFGIMVPYPGTKVGEMALNNEGGYKLISKDWDQFNKQIGNAVELEGITRSQLERIQIFGYIKVFLYNFRIWDFLKFCFQYKKEGFEALKKIAIG